MAPGDIIPEDSLEEPPPNSRRELAERDSTDGAASKVMPDAEAVMGIEKRPQKAVSGGAITATGAGRKDLLNAGEDEALRDTIPGDEKSGFPPHGVFNSLLVEPTDPELDRTMKTARKIMNRRRGALEKLAK